MDKKDSIILQQLEVIRSMTENNLKRMDSDFWGTPFANLGKTSGGDSAAPGEGAAKRDQPPTADGSEKEPEVREEDLPPEPIEDLLKELDEALETAKTHTGLRLIEVKSSIGARADLGRPTTTALENKNSFVSYLRGL